MSKLSSNARASNASFHRNLVVYGETNTSSTESVTFNGLAFTLNEMRWWQTETANGYVPKTESLECRYCSVCNMPLLDYSDVAIFSLHAAISWRQRQYYLIVFINTCIKTKSFRMKWQFTVRIYVSRAPGAPSVPHFHDQYLYKWPTSIARSSEVLNDGSLQTVPAGKARGPHMCKHGNVRSQAILCQRFAIV